MYLWKHYKVKWAHRLRGQKLHTGFRLYLGEKMRLPRKVREIAKIICEIIINKNNSYFGVNAFIALFNMVVYNYVNNDIINIVECRDVL